MAWAHCCGHFQPLLGTLLLQQEWLQILAKKQRRASPGVPVGTEDFERPSALVFYQAPLLLPSCCCCTQHCGQRQISTVENDSTTLLWQKAFSAQYSHCASRWRKLLGVLLVRRSSSPSCRRSRAALPERLFCGAGVWVVGTPTPSWNVNWGFKNSFFERMI